MSPHARRLECDDAHHLRRDQLEGGHATNALPQLAAANVNCRVLPEDTVELCPGLAEESDRRRSGLDHHRQRRGASPRIPAAPRCDARHRRASPTSCGPAWSLLPVMSTGATDGRMPAQRGHPHLRCSGFFNERDDNRAHGRDERIPVRSFYEGQQFLYEFVKDLSTAK